jgi:hypothetical protein
MADHFDSRQAICPAACKAQITATEARLGISAECRSLEAAPCPISSTFDTAVGTP